MTAQAAPDHHQLAINSLRFLAVDMVEKANSGHPGAPMGQAAMAYLLWSRHLRHSPRNPAWPNRDRFVLSCGHASAMLYSLLHVSGYDISLDDLKSFRQLGSVTPGHPEYDLVRGIETTTGPLGQGVGNAVGMAIAQSVLASRFNRAEFPVFDHRIWVFASDGDLMEGVSSEACSLAGHLRLGRLIVIYDDNHISIDGSTSLTFSERVGERFSAYGWHVQQVADGNDLDGLDTAFRAALASELPSLISVRTRIGYGSPNKQDTASAHGAPLGREEVRITKQALGWPEDPPFHVPDQAYAAFRANAERGERLEAAWQEMMARYADAHPQLSAELHQRHSGEPPPGWEAKLPRFSPADGPLATRKASGVVLNAVRDPIPSLIGGSADLTGSNNTYLDTGGNFSLEEPGGRNLFFGVREHGMGAILNGMALSRLLIPYCGTFLVFSDYMRAAIRLAALMKLPVKYVFTHDSIFLGEDGPTHQPVSQLLSLRSIPGLVVLRPADACETAEAWRFALRRQDGPTALVLSRQKLPILAETRERAGAGVPRGAYILSEASGADPRALLLASGSEVTLALAAQQRLEEEGIPVRVVSMPCWELFDAQEIAYRREVLPPELRNRLAIEAGTPLAWERYVGPEGDVLGIDRFGASAPYQQLAEHYGFTAQNVVHRVHRLLA